MNNDNNRNGTVHAETPEYLPPHAVSLYGNGDALDDFPVLKAFQQYIDAEHAKSRKRLLAMAVFFGTFTLVVVAIFVVLLINVSNRNQQLNDRLVEYAMKDRASSAVVVQPPQDTSAVLALTTKIEEMNRKMAEAQEKANKAVAAAEEKARQAAAAAAASQPKAPTAEELEIQRLKAQLADEKAKAEAEKRRQREQELEDYRRKHYPEYYAAKEAQSAPKAEPAPVAPKPVATPKAPAAAPKSGATSEDHDDVDQLIQDIDRILDDVEKQDAQEKKAEEGLDALEPIDYLKSGEEPKAEAETLKAKKPQAKVAKPQAEKAKTAKKPAAKVRTVKPKAVKPVEKPQAKVEETVDSHEISIGAGDSRTDWGIP